MKRRKKKREEEEVGEGWLLPYSDMMTLLLSLFIVLFSIAKVDSHKLQQVSSVFSQILSSTGSTTIATSQETAIDNVIDLGDTPKKGKGGAPNVKGEANVKSQANVNTISQAEKAEARLQAEMQQKQTFNQVTQEVKDELAQAGIQGNSTVKQEKDGIHINLDSNILFDSGSAELSDQVQAALKKLVPTLQKVHTYPVIIAGHTDNVPMAHTWRYASNWELSSARAISVMHFFVNNGAFNEDGVSVEAFADTKPVASNDTAAGRAKNRRVEIVIQKAKDQSWKTRQYPSRL